MKELGEKSAEAHRQVGALAARSDLQGLFLFGEEMESAFQEIRNQGFAGTADWMVDFDSLRSTLRSYIREGDLLLLKGSRAAELERILPDFSVRGSNGS
jgi:UDP-N-acetylmuramoyl-tripeptide--D-alanyl-D-alanine ligase